MPGNSRSIAIPPFRTGCIWRCEARGFSTRTKKRTVAVIKKHAASLPGLTRQSILFERSFARKMDARAFASPKRLRPRRRVKPEHDALNLWRCLRPRLKEHRGFQMRYRRPAQCRQVDAVQCADRDGGGAGGQLSVLHHRA